MSTNETKVKYAISKWLSGFECKIWWEKTNTLYDVFKAVVDDSGTVEKPDILIQNNDEKYYLCEVKNAEHNSSVYDAFFQTIRYATNKTEYFLDVDDSPLPISGYMVATQHSITGKLFSDCDKQIEVFSDGRNAAIERKELPKHEHNMTEQFSRLMWRGLTEFNCTKKAGVLLSDVLNDGYPYPLFLYKEGKQQGYEVWK